MHGNFIRVITSGIFKLALLAGLVVLGIVFVPDDFMAQVERKVSVVGNYFQTEASKRGPGLAQEFSRKTQEMKADAGGLYKTVADKYFVEARDWVLGLFGLQGK
jgi:hypothetical protein